MLRRCMARMAEQLAREPSHAAPTKRLTKLGPDDDVEAYLEIFERTAARERWPADQWGYILAPFLSGDAQRAYRDLSTAQAAHYPTLKRAILAHYGHSLPAQAQRFHDWVYDPLGSVRSQVSQLVRLAERWLVEGEGPPHLDRLVIDRCIRALPTGAKRWASGNQPRTVNDLVELLENHQVTQRLCGGATPAGGGAGETRTERRGRAPESQRSQAPPTRAPAYPNQTLADRRGPAPPTQREEWRCYTCGQTGHLARHCPGAGDVSMPTASPSDRRGGVCLRTTCWSQERTDTPSLRWGYAWGGTTPTPCSTPGAWLRWSDPTWRTGPPGGGSTSAVSTGRPSPTARGRSQSGPRRAPSRFGPGWSQTSRCPS